MRIPKALLGLLTATALLVIHSDAAENVTLNGTSYSIPDPGDTGWGQSLTDYLVATAPGFLQKAGGSFTLTADADFGASFGLRAPYFRSHGGSPATGGVVRLGNGESISWRNVGNTGELPLIVDNANNLSFNGVAITSPSGIVPATAGGTGLNTYTTGDTLYASATNILSKLAIGSSSDVCSVSGGIPSWGKLVNANVSASAAIAYSKLALSNSILNADVNSSAAIAYSKLALSNSVVNADINSSAAIAYSKLALSNSILNADINSSAAIANSKLATVAAHTFKGNNTGSSATPLDLTDTQATAELNAMVGDSGSGGTKGLVPAPGAGDAAAGKFLKADGTYAIPTGTSAVAPTQQRFTSSSGTYTRPTSPTPLYIHVRMVGGGGGGGGGSAVANADGGTGGTGGNTTFGGHTANGGVGGSGGGAFNGGAGGTGTIGAGAFGLVIPGQGGGAGFQLTQNATQPQIVGNGGGASFLGFGSPMSGGAPTANSGGGGAGGRGNPFLSGSAAIWAAAGGGGGGLDIIITSPSSTYSYGIGAAGAAGTVGTNGTAGIIAAAGYIEVTEYYQ